MSGGYWGKALRVNLSTGALSIEVLDEAFLRRYIGGWGFVAYTLLKELAPGIDPLGPENKLIFTTGPITGQPIAGGGRNMVGAKSPLTGGFAGSEVGGFFCGELKRAGWDTIILEGTSPRPVYLWIKDDQVELRDAAHLWGMETADAQDRIREELGDRFVRVAQIGPAGENLVRYACVMHDVNRAAGRTGLGAVMGSKRLKAIAVRGSQKPPVADAETMGVLAKWFRENYKNTGSAVFSTLGTMRMVRVNNNAGGLPTRNFAEGVCDTFEKFTAEAQTQTHLAGRDTCFACPVRCKWVVESADPEYPVDKKYGGPEYETVGSFGPCCGIDDLRALNRANQLCNAYGLDTIGCGVTIAWAMESFEKGLLTTTDTDGLELRFGNAAAMLTMIERIARREGLGSLLAEGTRRAAQHLGGGSLAWAVQIKGQEVAMHDPRVKYGHGLGIAVSPTGADHMHSVHDSGYQTVGGIAELEPLGVLEPLPASDLSTAKVRMVRYAMIWRVLNNLTGICMFHSWTPQQKAEMMAACTGWDTSVLELWLAAERAYDMARAFNAREGFGPQDDLLPPRLMEALPRGPVAGRVPTQQQFVTARNKLYELMGWDLLTAAPTRAKLEDLGVAWVADLLEEAR
jgi:aldehyde:ferredoxin oxidoreductase